MKEGLKLEQFNDNTVGNGNCSPSRPVIEEEKFNDGICINLRDWKMRKRSWEYRKAENWFNFEVVLRVLLE
jgi:hypothetical protein